MDPRLRVLYLAAIAVAVFLVKDVRIAGAIVGVHAGIWLALGHGLRPLGRQALKLWGFAAFVLASYAFAAEDAHVDRWTKIDLGLFHLPVNVGGLAVGGLMLLRVFTVVLASRVARTGDPRAVALGLRKLGAPDVIAAPLDTVLALLGNEERMRGRGNGGGGGGGGGGGRRRGRGTRREALAGFWASLKRIARGDVGPIVARLNQQIARATAHVDEQENAEGKKPRDRAVARDIAVIAGLSLTMLGIKALKVLPSIPVAPGHKLVLLTPLYIVASLRTRLPFGATLTGLVFGTVAFLLGDGRWGVFEILKHVAPGILCDIFVPLIVRLHRTRSASVIAWSLLGATMGVGRFATIFTVMLLMGPPATAWALLVPGLIIHTTFGVLSGLVSTPLIRALAQPTAATSEAASGGLGGSTMTEGKT